VIKYDIYKHIIDIFFINNYYALQKNDGQFILARDRNKNDLQITPDLIKSAIWDKKIILGTYTISKNNECQWLALDFDREGSVAKLRSPVFDTYKKAINYGLKPYLEFSGHKGYHLWVFFDKMPSEVVWKAAQVLGDGISGEIFPRQSSLTAIYPYGNLVRLPGCLNIKSGASTQWLGSNMLPISDQVGYFTKLQKTSRDKIERLAEQCVLSPDDKRQIVFNPAAKIQISNPMFRITKDRHRHDAQFPLIMKCLEAGYNHEQILEIGGEWLDWYSGVYKSDYNKAMSDFIKSLNYCENTYEVKRAK
jgi:hypothetical protein